MGGWFSKQPQLSTADEHRLARKCKSLSQVSLMAFWLMSLWLPCGLWVNCCNCKCFCMALGGWCVATESAKGVDVEPQGCSSQHSKCESSYCQLCLTDSCSCSVVHGFVETKPCSSLHSIPTSAPNVTRNTSGIEFPAAVVPRRCCTHEGPICCSHQRPSAQAPSANRSPSPCSPFPVANYAVSACDTRERKLAGHTVHILP
jgi:hypothetical protein